MLGSFIGLVAEVVPCFASSAMLLTRFVLKPAVLSHPGPAGQRGGAAFIAQAARPPAGSMALHAADGAGPPLMDCTATSQRACKQAATASATWPPPYPQPRHLVVLHSRRHHPAQSRAAAETLHTPGGIGCYVFPAPARASTQTGGRRGAKE